MNITYSLSNISSLDIYIKKPFIIFLKWDIWSWKTTLSKHIINNILWNKSFVTSPTYNYYIKYNDIYHFDLYRLSNYSEFFSIWWEDILNNNNWVIIIEWPELIEKYYRPDLEIIIKNASNENERIINIIEK